MYFCSQTYQKLREVFAKFSMSLLLIILGKLIHLMKLKLVGNQFYIADFAICDTVLHMESMEIICCWQKQLALSDFGKIC